MSSDTPERIGQYEILRPVGRGAMGVLYHARDTVSGREVALKVMSADTLEDEDARARFHHEARLAVRDRFRERRTGEQAQRGGEHSFGPEGSEGTRSRHELE